MGVFQRKEKVNVSEKASSYDGSDDMPQITGTISRASLGDNIVNVNGGVIASHDDDKHSRNLPYLQYVHYAKIQREYEDRHDYDGLWENHEKQLGDPHSNLSIEKIQTQKMLRRANFFAVFFLITTDILGPTNAPFAIAQMGLGPGVALYVIFGIFAMIGGYLLQLTFLKLDSNNYPLRTYGDIAARMFGPWSRLFISGLQFIQMILNVGVITLTSGQALSQMIQRDHSNLCFTVQVLVWALLGMVLGQIRSLRSFAHLANSAVWMNIAICIISMVGAATGPPNVDVAVCQGFVTCDHIHEPVRVEGNTNADLQTMIGGVSNMVFAWGGATIFCEVMAEMKRPRDFYKGMLGAQWLIMVIYLLFGIFMYCYQGQYVDNPANQGVSQYGLQTATNVLSLISGVLAGVLYGNVGLKVMYQGVGVTDLGFPALNKKNGIILWGILVVIYWGVAFIIGSAIPQVNNLTTFVGSLCILNFSYTFPFLFIVGMYMKDDAGVYDTYDPETATVTYHDKWSSAQRWKRAIFGGGRLRVSLKFWFFILALASLAVSGMGLYSSIENMITAYSQSSSSSFSCTSPAACINPCG